MLENIPQAIEQVIEVLAQKFGQTSIELWQVILRQQFVEARADLVLGIFCIIGILSGIYLIKWSIKEDNDWKILGVISTFLFLILGIIAFYNSYMEFVNPEYQAIGSIFRMISPSVR